MVSKELTEEQKQRRVAIFQDRLERQDDILGLSQVMKHGSTNTTMKPSGKTHSGRLPVPHDKKSIIPNQESKQCCRLFYIRDIVHYEFVPTRQTIN
jgi:hypothetical protein